MVKIKINFILGEREMQRVEVSLRFKITEKESMSIVDLKLLCA